MSKTFLFNTDSKEVDLQYFTSGRDNYNYFYRKLQEVVVKNGFSFVTENIYISESDIVLYTNLHMFQGKNNAQLVYALLLESPHIDINLVDTNLHKYFKKVFTWNDDLIDNIKYFKVNYAFDIPKTIPKKFKGKKLCCIIAGNKFANHPDELYTKRIDFIRWLEQNHLDKFDLYGTGWNQYRFGHSFVGRVLNKIVFLRKKNLFPSYKGMIDSKFETMQKYKFAICYENIKNQNGYITEKIFDCFFAGCIPIYWGAKNVTEHIPKECFIDKREFSTFEDIYELIKNMSKERYIQYLDDIELFLSSAKSNPFKAETFASTIVNEIIKDIEV